MTALPSGNKRLAPGGHGETHRPPASTTPNRLERTPEMTKIPTDHDNQRDLVNRSRANSRTVVHGAGSVPTDLPTSRDHNETVAVTTSNDTSSLVTGASHVLRLLPIFTLSGILEFPGAAA
ncbi:hypothetical protein ACH40E_41590 [Streptomyces acidicola]|uniref:hypothetical protein n=1 Tax=Streptomyces acidicola TaxID=2596892 RepID=UPI0037A5134B